jgi:hypothetical protein
VGLWCGQHHFLTSGLFVLSAFFITAAVSALAGIEAVMIVLVVTLITLATSRTIILRITSRRALTTAFASALFNALIPLSIVCHIKPPRLFID